MICSKKEMALVRRRSDVIKINSSLLSAYVKFCIDQNLPGAVIWYTPESLEYGSVAPVSYIRNCYIKEFIQSTNGCLALVNQFNRINNYINSFKKKYMEYISDCDSVISDLTRHIKKGCKLSSELEDYVVSLNSEIRSFNESEGFRYESGSDGRMEMVSITKRSEDGKCYKCSLDGGNIVRTNEVCKNVGISSGKMTYILDGEPDGSILSSISRLVNSEIDDLRGFSSCIVYRNDRHSLLFGSTYNYILNFSLDDEDENVVNDLSECLRDLGFSDSNGRHSGDGVMTMEIYRYNTYVYDAISFIKHYDTGRSVISLRIECY